MPTIGIEPGEIHSWADVDELGDVSAGEPVGLGKATLVLHSTGPGLEKVCPEGDYVLGPLQIVLSELVDAKNLPVGSSERLPCKRLIADHSATQGSDPLCQQVGEGSPSCTGDGADPIAGGTQLRCQASYGVVPGDLSPAAVSLASHGAFQPAGIIESLKRCLPPRAELSSIDRVLGIALELYRPSFPAAHLDSTPGGTLGA